MADGRRLSGHLQLCQDLGAKHSQKLAFLSTTFFCCRNGLNSSSLLPGDDHVDILAKFILHGYTIFLLWYKEPGCCCFSMYDIIVSKVIQNA
jgi:hypothetical protein